LTNNQRKELRQREYLTYTRINKALAPPYAEKVVPPLPPLVHELLPKQTPTKDEIQLNIDIAAMFGKLNMMVLVKKMCKIPSVMREILKLLQVPTEKEDPPIIFNTMYLD
jgi:hypothetical protein